MKKYRMRQSRPKRKILGQTLYRPDEKRETLNGTGRDFFYLPSTSVYKFCLDRRLPVNYRQKIFFC